MNSIIANTSQRLDSLLAERLPERSRSFWKSLIKNGQVQIDNAAAKKPGQIVQEGSTVTFRIPEPSVENKPAKPPFDFQILWEDEHALCIMKPAGSVVHHGSGTEDQDVITDWLYAREDVKLPDYTGRRGVVHRLDKGTSGVLLLTKNEQAERYYAELFEKKKLTKEYLAVVAGVFPHKHANIDAPIGRNPQHRTQMDISSHGKEALTEVYLAGYTDHTSLLHIYLHTGRTHQIRVHLSRSGFPILGDPTYGQTSELIDRPALHAWKLTFVPFHQQDTVTVTAPIPEDLAELLVSEGLQDTLPK